MKILVTGANGQLGSDVVALIKNSNHEVYAYNKEMLNITKIDDVINTVKSVEPDWILHCAAYTNVEAAEEEENTLNWQINKVGSSNIAKAAKIAKAKLIYISTDYVFDGNQLNYYEPEDKPNPINEYGAAKLAGEKEVTKELPKSHIIRTSWVFGENGKNFVYTMLNLAKKMNTLKVVNDQKGCPTYTKDLAAFMLYIVDNDIVGGIYHFCNSGEVTWFDFAKEILKNKDVDVIPVDSSEFVQKAKRPMHSVMSLDKVSKTGFTVPTWENALERFLNNI